MQSRIRTRRLAALAVLLVAVVVVVLAVGRVVEELRGYNAAGSEVEHFDINSRVVDGSRRQTVVVPPGGSDGRPLLVFLHGRGNAEDSNLVDEMFAALRSLGERSPVVAFPNGGEASYWHDRADGAWGRYVLREVIPEVEKRFNTNGKVALGGISMGGFGAYDLALNTDRKLCAVGGHSPALWSTAGETAAGAFDHSDDFAAHDVVGTARSDPGRFAGRPLWIDTGTEDPFVPGVDNLVAALRAGGVPIKVHRWPGGHEGSYWEEHWDEYLRFYARACS